MSSRGRRLGRGLGALFPTIPEATDNHPEKANSEMKSGRQGTMSQSNSILPAREHKDSDARLEQETLPQTVSQESALSTQEDVSVSKHQSQKADTSKSDHTLSSTADITATETATVPSNDDTDKSASVVSRETTLAQSTDTNSTVKKPQATMKNSELASINLASARTHDASADRDRGHSTGLTGSHSDKRVSRKRPTMPSLKNSVSPLDSIFGPSQTSSDTSKLVGANLFIEEHPEVSADAQDIEKGQAVIKEPLRSVNGWYLTELDVHDIVANEKQPRTVFDEDDLDELSRSIKEVGVLQPVVVRAKTHGDKHYELIMGERRWRATQRAGLTTIPAIVRSTTDGEMLREALLENLQRVALNPLEEAAAYQQMLDEFGITQAELSKSVSKSRPQIANTLRLLQLPANVQKRVASGVISAGHARALLSLGDEEQMEALANRIVAEGLSVRSTEEIVSMQSQKKDDSKHRKTSRNIWSGTETLQRLEDHFNTKVMIRGTKKRGKIEINFASEEDLDRILQLLNTQPGNQTDGEWK